MKKPILLLFLVSFLIFNCISCSKDEMPLVKLDPVFLSYFAFPVGSWWTYKEIHSGKTDSFYVNYYKIENFVNKKEGNKYYERLAYHLFSSHDTAYGQARPYYINDTPKDSIKYRFFINPAKGISGFYYKIAPGQKIVGGGDLYIGHLDTITIQRKLYSDVYYLMNYNVSPHDPIKTEYYCRNVGVIKREYFDGSIWELTNYQINK